MVVELQLQLQLCTQLHRVNAGVGVTPGHAAMPGRDGFHVARSRPPTQTSPLSPGIRLPGPPLYVIQHPAILPVTSTVNRGDLTCR